MSAGAVPGAAVAAALALSDEAKRKIKEFATVINQTIHTVEKLATTISGAITGLVYYGSRGTVEAQQLQQSFYAFARSVADFFAPVMRGAGIMLQRLSQFMNSLSQDMKYAVVGLTAVTIATTAFAAAVGALAGALLFVLANPIGAAIAAVVIGIAAIPAIFFVIKGVTEGWENALKNTLAVILDLWKFATKIKTTLDQWGLNKAFITTLKLLFPLLTLMASFKPSKQSRDEVDSLFKGPQKLTDRGHTRFEALGDTFTRIGGNVKVLGDDKMANLAEQSLNKLGQIEQNTRPKGTAMDFARGLGIAIPAVARAIVGF